ncbi:unnamed protein product [Rotaria sordida]|uniref:E3 ubiquitin-protein ligase n=1 Tax=Rotaria sordida TaxID=392033 RepID=A0A818GHU8_9BILA|nr:unnamed protein product [Rotaria sordida]CAF3489580.1 unnamed protein product [Rotaria sordida]
MAQIQNNSSSSTRRSLRLLTAERKSTINEFNIEEEEEEQQQQPTTTARQAKSKALEALSISHNKRRIETDSDINEDQEDNKKRTSSLSSRHSIVHASNPIRRRKKPSEQLSNIKTLKRQRESSSEEEEEEDNKSEPKRNSAPILSHHNRRKQSDLEKQSESTDTGNFCVKRRTGGREQNTVVSDPSTSNNRRPRRYTTKSYIDYLTTGQSSSSRSSVPVTNITGTENRSCHTNNNTGVTSSNNNPLHLFNSSTYYHQNSSSPPPSSSSAQTYSGIVPTTSSTSPFLTSSSAHRTTKQSIQMSTESDTDPDNSPTTRDILNDSNFVRSAASSGSASAALFHTLSGRVQHLMSRVGGGSSINGRLQQYIQGLQSSDPDVKLTTLNELCSFLVMSNEDTLPGFQFRALYPPLRDCLADENEANAEIALTACRALTYLMEALPRSAIQVVEATPIFLNKLRSITSIDIAEQALTALDMISKRNAKQILICDGIGACLEYIDFFSITSQHKALSIVANCCTHILTSTDFKYIREHLENLTNRLRSDDKKTIEHICLIFTRLVENFYRDSTILCEIASQELLKTMQTMIIVQPSLINSITFVSIIHMLYIFSAYCPILAITLLKMNIAETLICLLTGSVEGKIITKKSITYKSAALSMNESITNMTTIQQINNIELISRIPQELYEIVSLIGEMMPKLPIDEPLFQVDQLFRAGRGYDANANGYVLWHWQDDQGQLRPYSFQDSRTIEHAWQQHEEEVQLVISGRNYLLDLQQLQQINEETNQARFIKRVVTPGSPNPIESTSSPPSLSTDELGNNSSSPTTTTTTTTTPPITTTINNSSDVRTELLKDNIELYNSFVQSLFPILYEVYNTSAGPAVKHRCLQTLLRMIYYSSSDLLETILKQQSIASNIASMLASCDYRIVIGALQISEILMKKLPDIFSVFFYREGVVHQIEILIGFGITSTANLSISHTHHTTTSQSQFDLVHMNENSSLPTNSTLSESFDDQQIQPLSSDSSSISKTPSLPYRTTAATTTTTTTTTSSSSSRRYTESNVPKIETRSQRSRIPPTSSNSRIKPSLHSMFDEMTSSSTPSDTSSSIPIGRGRSTRGGSGGGATNSGFFRPTSFDTSSHYGSTINNRLHPTTPIYVPSPYLQQQAYTYATSAPAAASLIMSTSLSSRQQQSQITLTTQEKAKLKEWIHNQAQNFRINYFSNNSSTSNIALQIINRLAAAVDTLHVGKDHLENTKALRDIANIIAKGDVTPFEMVHSGLITKLFQYLTDHISLPNDRLDRLKLFLHTFMNIPHENTDDNEKDLKQFIIDLYHTQLNNGKSNQNILSHLICKLQGCINQLEQFPIRVNDVTGRSVHSSALRLISTHQLKCSLARHPQCKTLKQWNSSPVKIDPFALVSAIEKYLLLRGVANGSNDDSSGIIDDEESEVSNESDAEDVINVLAHSSTMRLEFLINDHIIPNNMTLYQAIRMYSTPTQRTADGESETDTDESVVSSSSIWTRVHTIHYRQLTNSSSSTVPAVSTAIGGASTTTTTTSSSSSNRLRQTTTNTQSSSSKSSKKPIKPSKRSPIRTTIDELWINGQCPKTKSLLISNLNESLSSILTINDLSLNAISLLHILNNLNLYWYDLYYHTNTMLNHHNLSLTLTSKNEYLSTKLTSKVNRQLQDPIVIMMGRIPSWITEMGYTCSFLFPFETRQMIFYPCAFDRERAMQRLLDSSDMLTQQHNNDQTDRQSVVPRIERKKVKLSRGNILSETEKILDNWNSKHFLEVQYEDEVGFGLGPTLEAYSLLSKELQKNGLELWRTDKIFDSHRDKDTSMSEYVDTHNGLYPAPLGRNAKANVITKVRQKFKFLGKFMAKALMDSRMIDMPFSIIFYKWMLGEEESLNLEDLIHIDANLYEQFKKLQTVVLVRDKIMLQNQITNQQITINKLNNKKRLKSKDDSQLDHSIYTNIFDENDPRLLLDGCKIDDLSLVFTLPGYPNIELKKGGKDCLVTIQNLDQYINLVVYWTLVEGVRRQFESFRDGFNSIFSIQHLKCFYPDELHQVFCGSGSTELWDLKVLLESTRCDHGYNLNSRAVKWLFDIMINFDIDEQRAFLQFVTGSPRLPVGGFRMLHPPLTIVRKAAENNSDHINPDSFLPSVMTCVNYLKLPDYSSKEIMKLKLTTAIRDGQYAFLLS